MCCACGCCSCQAYFHPGCIQTPAAFTVCVPCWIGDVHCVENLVLRLDKPENVLQRSLDLYAQPPVTSHSVCAVGSHYCSTAACTQPASTIGLEPPPWLRMPNLQIPNLLQANLQGYLPVQPGPSNTLLQNPTTPKDRLVSCCVAGCVNTDSVCRMIVFCHYCMVQHVPLHKRFVYIRAHAKWGIPPSTQVLKLLDPAEVCCEPEEWALYCHLLRLHRAGQTFNPNTSADVDELLDKRPSQLRKTRSVQ